MSKLLLGVDLGGHKIRVVVVSSDDPLSPKVDRTIVTPREGGYNAVLSALTEIVQTAIRESGTSFQQIGIGTPGVVDPQTQTLKNSNTQCLNGRPLLRDLQDVLGVSIQMQNDANCFALAEDRYGAAQGSKLTFGVIMGTGVGGGIIVDGRARFGRQGIAGEWGHNLVEPQGEPCYCGRAGCVETVISGPGLERDYTKRTGLTLKLPEIYERSQAGEVAARETVTRLIEFFGRALGPVINILDPDVIVLGGGVSNVGELYTRGVAEVVKYVFNTSPNIRIVQNALGASAGVFGAALLTDSRRGD